MVFAGEVARYYNSGLEADTDERFDQVTTLLSNLGAHELGHTLGLEHATEQGPWPNNLMGYNDNLEPQTLQGHNEYWYQPIGFTNSIDILLRNIGSGSPMGS